MYHLKRNVCNYINNNNNKHFFNLQVANSPSRLRFEANLSRESSECTEHSQDQTSQINVYVLHVCHLNMYVIIYITSILSKHVFNYLCYMYII